MARKQSRKRRQLIYQLILVLIVFGLLFIISFSVATFNYNVSYLDSVAQEMQGQLLMAQKNAVMAALHQHLEVFFSIAADQNLWSVLQNDDLNRYPFEQNRQILQILRNYISMQSDIISVHIITNDGSKYTYERNSDTMGKVWSSDSARMTKQVLEKCEKTDEIQIFHDLRKVPLYGPMFHMGIKLRDLHSSEDIGILVVTFTNRSLVHALSTSKDTNYITQSLITTQSGEIIANTSLDWSQSSLKEMLTSIGSDIVVQEEDGYYGLRIVNILDKHVLLKKFNCYSLGMIGVFVILMGLYLTCIVIKLHSSARTIKRLTDGIKAVESGRLDVVVKPISEDEFADISDAFTKMVARLKQTTAERERENSEKLQALRRQHKAEMTALESQINSHFLANTINMIGMTAIEGGNHEVSRLLKALSNCMRYTFNNNEKPVVVRNELNSLNDYLMLQKERCGKKFDYFINADKSVLDDPIKKFMLQPFVENCIAHGFFGVHYGGLIKIQLRRFQKNGISVSVYDNGGGMSKVKAAKIRAMFSHLNAQDTPGFGIHNVVLRMRIFYPGAKLILRTSSTYGTKINIFLPHPPIYKKDEEY